MLTSILISVGFVIFVGILLAIPIAMIVVGKSQKILWSNFVNFDFLNSKSAGSQFFE